MTEQEQSRTEEATPATHEEPAPEAPPEAGPTPEAEATGAAPEPEAGADRAEPAEKRAEDAEAKAAEYLDRLRRMQADFENARRRLERDTEDAKHRANESLLKALLEVLDSFDRALEEPGDREELVDGLRLIKKQLDHVLTMQGLERIEVLGQPFDPARHEALVREPSAEHAPDTVLREFEGGYTYRGRVLRPARVSVSVEAPEPDEPVAEASDDPQEAERS